MSMATVPGWRRPLPPPPGRSFPPLEPIWSEAATLWSVPNTAIVAAGVTDGEVVRNFNGKVDSPRIFSRCLLDSELEALAFGADPRSVGGLAAAWSFDPVHDTQYGHRPRFRPDACPR